MARSYKWENASVDLNFRHYAGRPSDIIKYIKLEIEEEIKNGNISTEQDLKIYSAVYNALDYYKTVSYLPDAELQIEETFLSHTIDELNKDLAYLSKYNDMYPNDSPVITMSARIKSPLSFLEKAKKKIDSYLKENRDLTHLNESLRDLIGAEIIVNPPKEIKDKGKQAESDFLYTVYLDFMKYHGIYNETQESQTSSQYKFIDIDTNHNPTKNQSIKDRVKKGFAEGVAEAIFIPKTRPAEMNDPIIDSKTKDYNMHPKENGYQSLHTCVIPGYSKTIDKFTSLPNIIVNPSPYNCCLEYIIETKAQYDYSSCREDYKPFERVYHRSAVPTFILPDENGKFKIKNFADSLEKFYGISFIDLFKIPFRIFRDKYPTAIRNKILAFRAEVIYDKETNTYSTRDVPMPAAIPSFLQKQFIKLLKSDHAKALKFLELQGVLDSRYYVNEDVGVEDLGLNTPVLYSVETLSDSQNRDTELELDLEKISSETDNSFEFTEDIIPDL